MITIMLEGHLYWYNKRKKVLLLEPTEKSVQALFDDLNIPTCEIGTIIVNNEVKDLSHVVCDHDEVTAIPIVCGG